MEYERVCLMKLNGRTKRLCLMVSNNRTKRVADTFEGTESDKESDQREHQYLWLDESYEGARRGVPKTLRNRQFSTIASCGVLGYAKFSRSACQALFRFHRTFHKE